MEIEKLLCTGYICYCGHSFTTKRSMKRHQKSVHGPFMQCKLCGKHLKCFNRKDLQSRHLEFGCNGFIKYCEKEKIKDTHRLAIESISLAFF